MAYLVSNICTKLLESDNYCWNYPWWLGGSLFWDTVYKHRNSKHV